MYSHQKLLTIINKRMKIPSPYLLHLFADPKREQVYYFVPDSIQGTPLENHLPRRKEERKYMHCNWFHPPQHLRNFQKTHSFGIFWREIHWSHSRVLGSKIILDMEHGHNAAKKGMNREKTKNNIIF